MTTNTELKTKITLDILISKAKKNGIEADVYIMERYLGLNFIPYDLALELGYIADINDIIEKNMLYPQLDRTREYSIFSYSNDSSYKGKILKYSNCVWLFLSPSDKLQVLIQQEKTDSMVWKFFCKYSKLNYL